MIIILLVVAISTEQSIFYYLWTMAHHLNYSIIAHTNQQPLNAASILHVYAIQVWLPCTIISGESQ